jgi:hypothetical protein
MGETKRRQSGPSSRFRSYGEIRDASITTEMGALQGCGSGPSAILARCATPSTATNRENAAERAQQRVQQIERPRRILMPRSPNPCALRRPCQIPNNAIEPQTAAKEAQTPDPKSLAASPRYGEIRANRHRRRPPFTLVNSLCFLILPQFSTEINTNLES